MLPYDRIRRQAKILKKSGVCSISLCQAQNTMAKAWAFTDWVEFVRTVDKPESDDDYRIKSLRLSSLDWGRRHRLVQRLIKALSECDECTDNFYVEVEDIVNKMYGVEFG